MADRHGHHERYCRDKLPEVSRTFAPSIRELDGYLEDAITAAYLLCRGVDTLEDTAMLDHESKTAAIETYIDVIDNDADPAALADYIPYDDSYPPEWDLVQNIRHPLQMVENAGEEVEETVLEYTVEMAAGMQDIVARHPQGIRIQDKDELGEYCYYVAGIVGHLLTDLFAHVEQYDETTTAQLRADAEGFGEALQLVNIVKDVYPDYHEENTIYIPAQVLAEYDRSHADVTDILEGDAPPDPQVLAAVGEIMDRAEHRLSQAQRYISTIPEGNGVREFVTLPYLLAVGSLREARTRSEDVLRDTDVKVSRMEVAGAMEAVEEIPDSRSLDTVAATAAEEPLQPGPWRQLQVYAYKARKGVVEDIYPRICDSVNPQR